MPERAVPLGVLLKRGIRRQCPVCGYNDIFDSYFKLKERCPNCGYVFAREEGYWVSAIIVNTAVIEGLFLALFMVMVVATAPQVPWGPLLSLATGLNVLFPIAWYPFSKTIWMAIDHYFHPPEPHELVQDRS